MSTVPRYQVEVDDKEMVEVLKSFAKREGRTIKYVVKAALKEYIKKHDKPS